MRTVLFVLSLIMLTPSLPASEVVAHLDWSALKQTGEILGGTVVSDKATGAAALEIENSAGAPTSVSIWTRSNPGISEATYAILGKIRCEDVQGEGYIELLNYFESAGPYFRRTLSPTGPMRKLSGSSDWREFMLPFYVNDGSAKRPTRLDMSIHFAGHGKVWLGPVDLVEYRPGESPKLSGAWWSDQQAGIFGGIGGSVIGCIGAAIGVLTALGRARSTISALLGILVLIGLCGLIGGVAAIVASQPYAVWYPLLLVGFLCTILPLTQLRTIKRRFESLELRRIQAQDLT